MKAHAPDRQALMRDLASKNRETWIEVKSEIHYDGGELPVWFLVASKEKAVETWAVFLSVVKPYLAKFQETEFTVSFQELAGDRMIWWGMAQDDEIREEQAASEVFNYSSAEEIGPNYSAIFEAEKRYLAERGAKKGM